MPAAIATSKRKFHDLLERITSVPQDQTSNKRPRIATHSALPTDTTRTFAVPKTRVTSAARVAAKSESPLFVERIYSPWSHDSFLARLSTFAELRHWTSKPDAVNEVAWARGGWTCDTTAVNRVACRGGCEQRVLVQLRPRQKDAEGNDIPESEDYGIDVDDNLVERYAQLISDGHSEECLWRQHGCSDDIYRMPIARPSVWVPELKTRYTSFTHMLKSGGRLPSARALQHPLDLDHIKPLLPATLLDAITQVADEAIAEARQEADVEQTYDDVALAFALLGWECVQQNGMQLATCRHCFRRLGLWLYTVPPNTSASDEAEESDAANDGNDNANNMKLDLVDNHRDYCPWINGTSQRQPGSLAGLAAWQVLQRSIENHASFEASGQQLHRVSEPVVQAATLDTTGESEKSVEQIEKEDKRRAQRLMEFTRSMGKRIGLGRRK